MYKIAVIGDYDSIYGFATLGLSICPVKTREDARKKLKQLADGQYGIIYIPKYIFPLSKCLFVGINFLLTLIPLYGVILLSGSGETKCHITALHLLLPYSYLCLLLFTVGVGFILSTISIFLRDMFYIYGIVLTILTYFTPIMYDINMLDPWIQQVLKFNPLYHYITFARTIILYDQMPSVKSFIICGASCLITLVIGMIVFKKNQDKFIYYM